MLLHVPDIQSRRDATNLRAFKQTPQHQRIYGFKNDEGHNEQLILGFHNTMDKCNSSDTDYSSMVHERADEGTDD
jgi:hypothetical protein